MRNVTIFQMGIFRRLLEAVASCLPVLPAWFSPPKERSLSSKELQERLNKAAEEDYFCSGHEFYVEGNDDAVLECGCEKGRHGPLAIDKEGQLFYLA